MNFKNKLVESAARFINRNYLSQAEASWKACCLALSGRLECCEGITDDYGSSFKEYIAEHGLNASMAKLAIGLDDHSLELLEVFKSRLLNFPESSVSSAFLLVPERYITEQERMERRDWIKNFRKYCRRYHIKPRFCIPESIYFHHGLRALSPQVHEYICGKDFIDAGAFVGDSALVLQCNYAPHKVWSFDLAKENRQRHRDLMELNGIPASAYEYIISALGDKTDILHLTPSDMGSGNVNELGTESIPMITLDDFVRQNIKESKIGFIKADVEGMGLKMAAGMEEVLKRDRPVLSLAIYHNPDEFFGIKPYLESLNLNYRFSLAKFRLHFNFPLVDTCLIAVPAELQ